MASNEKDLDYFKGLEYDIIVRKNKGKFLLYISELSLYEESENLDSAYEKLDIKKQNYFQKVIGNGLQNHITEPERKNPARASSWNMAPFLAKLIVTFSIVAFFVIFLDDISSTFKHIRRASKNIEKTDFSQISLGNVDEVATKIAEALDDHEIAKQEKKLISKYKLLTPADVYASGNLTDYPAKFAVDSSRDTFWHSTGNEAHLVVSLNSPTKLNVFSITSRPDLPGLQGPDKCIIEGSNDNKNWKYIDEASQLVWKQGEIKRIFIENNEDYIHYKFNFTKKEVSDFISIVELELYGNLINATDSLLDRK
jgi:hypothetical protein